MSISTPLHHFRPFPSSLSPLATVDSDDNFGSRAIFVCSRKNTGVGEIKNRYAERRYPGTIDGPKRYGDPSRCQTLRGPLDQVLAGWLAAAPVGIEKSLELFLALHG